MSGLPEGSPAAAAAPQLPAFHQVAFAVRDLDAAVRRWADDLGIGPWNVWTMRPPALQDTLVGGESVEFGIRHALAWSGGLQFELVEPLEGPGIFVDQLAAAPGEAEVFSHVGVIVPDHAAAWADLESRGFSPLQSARGFGASRDGIFAYFAPPGGGSIIELISPPTERFAPEHVYPES